MEENTPQEGKVQEKKTGRPEEYNDEMQKKAERYLEGCKDVEGKVNLPSIASLARYLGIARETVYDWKDKYPLFSDIVKDVLSEQEMRLVNSGLSGAYNASISKLILTKHGYSDRTETDVTSKGEKLGMTDEQAAKMDAFLSALRPKE